MKQVSDGMPVQHHCATDDGASVIPSGGEQSRRDARDALAQEVTENPQRVQGALPTRAKDRHEDLLRVRRPPGAIASADFTIHDGRAERLFSAPVECRAYCYAEPQLLRPRQSVIVKGFHSA
jgi:hypothetical protein